MAVKSSLLFKTRCVDVCKIISVWSQCNQIRFSEMMKLEFQCNLHYTNRTDKGSVEVYFMGNIIYTSDVPSGISITMAIGILLGEFFKCLVCFNCKISFCQYLKNYFSGNVYINVKWYPENGGFYYILPT